MADEKAARSLSAALLDPRTAPTPVTVLLDEKAAATIAERVSDALSGHALGGVKPIASVIGVYAAEPLDAKSKRLRAEHSKLAANLTVSDCLSAEVSGDLRTVTVVVPGLSGTDYAGGRFVVRVTLPPDYPMVGPGVRVLTKVYHPNVSPNGGVCVDLLKDKWSPALMLFSVIRIVAQLINGDAPWRGVDSPVCQDPGLWASDLPEARKRAREWTALYAAPKYNGSSPRRSVLCSQCFRIPFQSSVSSIICFPP
jgi:ubiquitin-conjugating enzyme E2 N